MLRLSENERGRGWRETGAASGRRAPNLHRCRVKQLRNSYSHPVLYTKGYLAWYPHRPVVAVAGTLDLEDQRSRLIREKSPDRFG